MTKHVAEIQSCAPMAPKTAYQIVAEVESARREHLAKTDWRSLVATVISTVLLASALWHCVN